MHYLLHTVIPCVILGYFMYKYADYSANACSEFLFKMDLLKQRVYKTTKELKHQLIFTLIGELVTYNALYMLVCWICAYIVNE